MRSQDVVTPTLALIALIFALSQESLGQVGIHSEEDGLYLKVLGDPKDDWRVFVSEDLKSWAPDPSLGTILLGGGATTAPRLRIETGNSPRQFFRVEKTDGLYDDTVLRSVYLTFAEGNWQSRLSGNHSSGTNLIGDLQLGNGAAIEEVGVRYRGNTSYLWASTKKSINIEVDATEPQMELMGYDTLNLNNAFTDDSMMRETIYFNVMHRYAPSPQGSFARLYINGEYWGVYSFAQQEDGKLVNQWFPSKKGDRWRAPNIGGGGFSGGGSALTYLGPSRSSYQRNYELKKTEDEAAAWARLIHATDVLNNTPAAGLRDAVATVLAVDSWLWFLAVENIFADDDSYFHKGADYIFYYEPKTGRYFPIEHDGNESFFLNDVNLSPLDGLGNSNRPVLDRLLSVPEYRQRYLAHMRTVLDERFNPAYMDALIDRHNSLIAQSVEEDTKKNFSMAEFRSAIGSLRTFVRQRHAYLTAHAELLPRAPTIHSLTEPDPPYAGTPVTITATVDGSLSGGVDSVWLYYGEGPSGIYSRMEMTHVVDGEYEATPPGFLAGKVDFYVEARAGNNAKAASFLPRRAERNPRSFRVLSSVPSSAPRVQINESMAINESAIADPQGEFDDWIELRNLTATAVDLTGHYLSDNANNARKWQFPDGTVIPASGYRLIWADENGEDTPGLHATFKLAGSGETILLVGPDLANNPLLDSVSYPPQFPDQSYGRVGDEPDWQRLSAASPGQE